MLKRLIRSTWRSLTIKITTTTTRMTRSRISTRVTSTTSTKAAPSRTRRSSAKTGSTKRPTPTWSSLTAATTPTTTTSRTSRQSISSGQSTATSSRPWAAAFSQTSRNILRQQDWRAQMAIRPPMSRGRAARVSSRMCFLLNRTSRVRNQLTTRGIRP